MSDRYEVFIVAGTVNGKAGYYAELWRAPFSGRLMAATSLRSTPQAAVKDAKRYLRIPEDRA